jgi:phosphohistidine phosphatase
MPTRRLYLLRHAKSSWDDALISDHDRPLAARGRRALDLLSSYIAEHELEPDLILCSTARRARETLGGLPLTSAAVQFEPGLYSAHADDLVARLAAVDPGIRSVMVIGHNPALQILILRLTGGCAPAYHHAPSETIVEIGRKFPTGALATLDVDCAWGQLHLACAELAEYVRPKALQYL